MASIKKVYTDAFELNQASLGFTDENGNLVMKPLELANCIPTPLAAPATTEPERQFSTKDLPSARITFNIDGRGCVPVFVMQDGKKVLQLVSPEYLNWMLALGLWGVEW